MNETPMKNMLDHILENSENKEAAVILQFPNGPLKGALRHFDKVKGIYELLATMSEGPNTRPHLVSNFFTAESVSRVLVIHPDDVMPQIVRPASNGGLVIPT